jgi:hypothetical protein
MRRGLAHPEPAVPQLVLHQLLRFVGDDELAAMVGHHDIFLPALNLLGGDLANAAEVSSAQCFFIPDPGFRVKITPDPRSGSATNNK